MCHKAAFYFQFVVGVCSGHRAGLVGEDGQRWSILTDKKAVVVSVPITLVCVSFEEGKKGQTEVRPNL